MSLIIYYIDKTYGTTNYTYGESPTTPSYTSYAYMDVVDNEILNLKDAPENIKLELWTSSPIPEEVLNYFPHMEIMQEVFNDRVEDNGTFKENFYAYMELLQFNYRAGDISELQFKKSFLNPPKNLKITD